MSKGFVRLVVLAAVVGLVGVVSVVPSSAHDEATYYDGRWRNDDLDNGVEWHFTAAVPSGTDFRSRVVDSQATWNGEPVPMFFDQAPEIDNPGNNCESVSLSDVGAVHYKNIDGGGGTLGVTSTCALQSAPNTLRTFKMNLDDSENWYTGTGSPPGNQIDVQSVATHEFGHAAGAQHFPNNNQICPNNSTMETMCPFYTAGTGWLASLESHDKHTFSNAYP